jgi:L-malate glycosyltransferase
MILESTFPIHGGGGAESQVLTLGKCLRERDVGVEVIVPMVAAGTQLSSEEVEGLRVTRIIYPKFPLVGGAVMLTRLALLLFVRRRQYSFIHAHIANNMAAVSALVGALLGKPVLIKLTGMTEMVGGILDPNPGIATHIKKWAMRRGAILQATSLRIRQMLIDSGFDTANVIHLPNGVDVARFVRANRNSTLRNELCGDAALVGIFVGRLAAEKGHELLFECWAHEFANRNDVKLVLVGDGPQRTTLQLLAARLGIDAQVVFAGASQDVAKFLAVADFGVLTSLAEGLSNALLEYMASGLPVVGSRVSGTEDFVVPGETGWLFEPGDRASLELALRALARVEPEQLRTMGEQAQRRIVASASLEAVTTSLMNLYQFESTSPAKMLVDTTAS